MFELLATIDWNSFFLGVIATVVLGLGGAFLIFVLGQGL
jgi:hypothetical protein